ncbi:Pectic acid lyase [Botrimarina colliarenosi]|uniref:Pectic acid lyase n=1 Tax=Botrimarina colliarenosi TaxID=2528001 RepID=A0A5C6AMG5_9BACT|nr:squalene--hopene cyclase [Botrimarina colliarenosi]TWU00192.1 Pectic acid lyase [Botrimarina colliarenosi]
MSLTTLLIALALIAAGVCAAMAFTDWGRRRPLHRYGALSIGAHLLLLAAMAGIRVGGPPRAGAEDAPLVKVRIVMRTPDTPTPEAEPETKPAPAVPEEEQDDAPVETPPEPDAVEPPPLLAEAPLVEPVPLQKQPDTEQADETPAPTKQPITPAPTADFEEAWATLPRPAEPEPTPPDAPTEPAADQQSAAPLAPIEPVQRSTPPEVTPVPRASTPAPTSVAPSAYAQRGELTQRRLSADQGGTQESLDAVAAAVDWLARAQRPDGGWDAERWGAGRETYTLDQDRKGAGQGAETGLTALALLAMGGAGHTHLAGPYRDVVTRGLQFLLDQQKPNGELAGDATLYARTYCHSMATFALAEAMAVTDDERLRPAVEAAAAYLVRSQSHTDGGWRYQPGDRGDMSQMGWIVMALRSAEIAGVAIPAPTWTGCERFVASVQRGPAGGLGCYQPRGATSSTMTAEAMYCRQILGVTRHGAAAEDEAAAYLLTDLPGAPSGRSSPGGKANLYYWYYGTLALHHHRSTSNGAEQAWRRWNDAMQRTVLPKQAAQGPTAGSWGPDTVWGGYGGRVYSTALATMCLEVYYRYDPEKIGRDPWIAARPGVLRR